MDSEDDHDIACIDDEFSEEEDILSDEKQSYMLDVANFLISHQCVSTENALEINRNMQKMLLQMKERLEEMLTKCREKYQANAKALSLDQFKSRTKRRNCISYCGAPYFKDQQGFTHPPNKDYIYRKTVLNELFPIDVKSTSIPIWTVKDKIGVIQGIKAQVIDYLKTKQKLTKMGNYGNTLKRQKDLEKHIAVHSQRLVDLMSQVDSDFKVNWFRISTELGGRHPENCCEAMWMMYLRPDLSRENWTIEENQKLLAVVEKHRFQDWEAIAQNMGNRSSYQCFVQFRSEKNTFFRNPNGEKQKWTKEQDDLLKEAVEANRIGDIIMWAKVASHFPNKTKSQLYTRYKYGIDPSLKKGTFTEEEDCIILAAVQEYGENFYLMPRSLFPGRTLTQIKAHYYNALKQSKSHKVWNVEDDKELVELINKHGPNWSLVAKYIKTHTRISCRTRYQVIQKYLEKDPNNTIENIPRKRRGTQSQVSMDNWVEKIIEIRGQGTKEKAPQNKMKPKPSTYRELLRSITRDYYEFLKYSYDFKFDLDRRILITHMKPFECLKHLFSLRITATALKSNKKDFNANELKILTRCLQSDTPPYLRGNSVSESVLGKGFCLPPSWCTILGLRAVCIHTTADTLESNPNPSLCEEHPNEEAVKRAKLLFKKRFFSLFYKSALIGELSPSIREELTGDKYTIEPFPKRRKTDLSETSSQGSMEDSGNEYSSSD